MLKPRCAQDITPSTNKINRMRHNGVMASPQYSRISTRIGQIFVVTALVVGGAAATAYVAARFRRQRETQHLADTRSEEHTSELQSRGHLVCRLLLEKKKYQQGAFFARHCYVEESGSYL